MEYKVFLTNAVTQNALTRSLTRSLSLLLTRSYLPHRASTTDAVGPCVQRARFVAMLSFIHIMHAMVPFFSRALYISYSLSPCQPWGCCHLAMLTTAGVTLSVCSLCSSHPPQSFSVPFTLNPASLLFLSLLTVPVSWVLRAQLSAYCFQFSPCSFFFHLIAVGKPIGEKAGFAFPFTDEPEGAGSWLTQQSTH